MTKHTHFTDEIEHYPRTKGSTIVTIVLWSLLAAFIAIQYIFGADRFISWAAGVITG